MEPILTTNNLVDAAIVMSLGYMAWKMRNVDEIRTDIAVIKSVVENLPIPKMQEDIQRNRHKIADMDKGLAAMGEKVSAIQGKCKIYHGD